LCARLDLSKLRISWDVDTRWNSTYMMSHCCFPYKHTITESLNNSTEWIHLLISERECDQLEKLKFFLGVFFTATVKLSCSYTLSTHELLHHLYCISKMNYLCFNLVHFNICFLSHFFLYFFSQKIYREMKDIESLDSFLSPIVEIMKEKIFKYWEEVPVVTIISNCLHSSFKKKNTP
jgi:hypothetical protein